MNFEDSLKNDGQIVYTNVGVSMLPWIKEGKDVVVIKNLVDDPKRYDVVLYKKDAIVGRGRYVLHRVMWKYKNNKYFIIGDNETYGEKVDRENILGVLTHIVRDGKKIDVNGGWYKFKVFMYWHLIFPLKYLKGCVNGIYVRLFK